MRTWQPDVDLDLERCHEIVSGQFPVFTGSKPVSWGQGWDNLCVLYDGRTVFRLPTRKMGGEILLNEIAALPLLAGKLPLAVPRFDFAGEPCEGYPYSFVGYEALPGTTADRLVWTSEMRQRAIVPIAHFLQMLHQVPIEPFDVLPKRTFDQTEVEWFLDRIRFRAEAVISAMPERAGWAGDLVGLAANLSGGVEGDPSLAVVHGDLYPRHILADSTGNISGVIDWGDIQLAHPGVDLSICYTFFEPEEQDAFWLAYGLPVSKEACTLAQLKAILYALALVGCGHDVGDVDMYSLGEAIGRRVVT